jgi:hypothetical protein
MTDPAKIDLAMTDPEVLVPNALSARNVARVRQSPSVQSGMHHDANPLKKSCENVESVESVDARNALPSGNALRLRRRVTD